jgi:N-acetylglucosaminyldiphosphoundecaprenol N-acetyl-beta-D-mannosaminyltransferase
LHVPQAQHAAAPDARRTLPVLGTPIDVIDRAQALQRIADWASRRESRVVCFCNAHSVVTAQRQPGFAEVLRSADLAAPDGAPVAWMQRRQGATAQARLSGPDLMLDYCADAARRGEPIYLYGSQPDTLAALQARLLQRWPTLRIAGAHAPPFRPSSAAEDADDVARINASGAATVWVGLGCPKQEAWMAAHRGRVHAVMLGVGAAFDFHAGVVPRAPRWMREHGLEWLHRLATEPRRLGPRYLSTNAHFVWAALRQWWVGGTGRT